MTFHPDDIKAVQDARRPHWLGFIEAAKVIEAIRPTVTPAKEKPDHVRTAR